VSAAREPATCGEPSLIRRLGPTDYVSTWRAMQAFTDARAPETPDEIWLTEHPPIYTLGLAGRREHLRRDNGIPVASGRAAAGPGDRERRDTIA